MVFFSAAWKTQDLNENTTDSFLDRVASAAGVATAAPE